MRRLLGTKSTAFVCPVGYETCAKPSSSQSVTRVVHLRHVTRAVAAITRADPPPSRRVPRPSRPPRWLACPPPVRVRVRCARLPRVHRRRGRATCLRTRRCPGAPLRSALLRVASRGPSPSFRPAAERPPGGGRDHGPCRERRVPAQSNRPPRPASRASERASHL